MRENVWEGVKKVGGKSATEVRAYSDAEVENILSRSDGAKRLFYWLAVESGLRKGEICGLRVCDVDPFKKLVRVRQAVWRGKVQTPKTKNAIRDIPIPVEIVDGLRVHIGSRAEGFVFTTENGTPLERGPAVKTASSRQAESERSFAHVSAYVRHTPAKRGSADCCRI
ncbi:MAG TPA: tyrosine-type recombinase/integrase [Candidatus Acidoferrales bacterium]|nr:tyrosine-type recombinase/integrase [Candidatus Acidoferrales bacterium]